MVPLSRVRERAELQVVTATTNVLNFIPHLVNSVLSLWLFLSNVQSLYSEYIGFYSMKYAPVAFSHFLRAALCSLR